VTFEAGARLGPYELLSLLGSGGMGDVYRARDTELARFVAIKVLKEAPASSLKALSRIEREARLASSLNHPNIITVYSIGRSEGGVPYIAMELVEGKTLYELIAGGPLPLPRVVEIAAQIASAIAKAHDAGVVHRDLKPQNVMVTRDGLVKVLDFGLGTLTPDLADADPDSPTVRHETPLTAVGVLVGTPDYMSPEQASTRPVDYRSDQFCFGSMLYELVTGRRPFHRATDVQTLAAIIQDPPEPIATRGDIPPMFPAVIERCLAKDPDERYASTLDLAREMQLVREQILQGRSRSGSMFVARRAPPRRRIGVQIAAAVIAVALVTVVVTPRIRTRVPFWPAGSRAPARQELVVLPFANIGNDAASQPFGDGLVETLTTQLTQIGQLDGALQVVPASDVRREGVASARDAQRVFGVTRVITGSVQRTATHVRVTVNLVDANTLRQLSARSIDLELQDVAAMQDGVVREVAGLLGAPLPPEARRVLTLGNTAVPSAYDFYLQGRGYLQRYEQPESVELAINLFQRAVEQDGDYALAQAGLGEAYWRKYQLTKDERWVAAARNSCAAALSHADNLAAVYVTLGLVDAGTGRYAEAVTELKRAIALEPSNGDAYRELAGVYQALGQTAEAEATFNTAIGVRPTYWANYNALGILYFRLSRYAEAETQFKRVIALTPDNARAYSNLGSVYALTKRYDEAAAMLERSLAIKPNAQAASNLGTVYFSLGRYADAARKMEQALAFNEGDSQLWSNLAGAYHWAPGERAKARPAFLRALELAEKESRVNPQSADLILRMADCRSMLGEAERARGLAAQALKLAPKDVTVMYKAGTVYEQVGDRNGALDLIGKALDRGYPRDIVDRSPSLGALRLDPRFVNRKGSPSGGGR
jgi:tetratricopeptide (TPR) repeat protein/TolB-like protein